MASYYEIKTEDDDPGSTDTSHPGTDLAQPSTSTSGHSTIMKSSDSYGTKGTDVSFNIEGSQESDIGRSPHKHYHKSREGNHVKYSHSTDTVDHKEPEHGTNAEVREYDFCIKNPISDGPIIDLRGREVLFAIAVFFFLSVSIGLVVVLASNNLKGKDAEVTTALIDVNGDPELCLSAECLERASHMLSMMDKSSPPCEDFWRYACGQWLDQAEIPPSETSWGVDKELKAKLDQQIQRIIDRPVKNDHKDSAERKMKVLYKKCMDLDTIDELGLEPINEAMDKMGGWAIKDDWNLMEKPGHWNFQTVLQELHNKFFVRILFDLFVRPDDMRGGEAIQFDQSVLPYGDLFEDDSLVADYHEYMRTVASEFGATENSIIHFVNETWNFEKALAQLHMSEMDPARGNPMENYNRVTLAELEEDAPRISWVSFLKPLFPEVHMNYTVLVTSRDFFRQLSQLLSATDERTLNYYMMWRLVDDSAMRLPYGIRHAHNKFVELYDGKTRETRHEFCMNAIGGYFGFEIGAGFVAEYFTPEDKTHIEEMISDIQAVLRDRIAACDWLDNATRKEAIAKLDDMQFRVGFPDFILNQTALDEYYILFEVDESSRYFDIVAGHYTHLVSLMRQHLHGIIVAPDWLMQTYELNAFMNPVDNIIVFPAGLLQSPHYKRALPNYVNYGSIGSVIGHEMNHAFDNKGYLFDSNHQMAFWWGEDAMAALHDKFMCIGDYYSKFTVNGHQIDGSLSIDENLADIEGLKLAYSAYQAGTRRRPEERRLPGIDLTSEQIFFLSYAQNYCKIRREDLIEEYLETSSHMIENIRVRGALSQVLEFSTAFGCKKNSPLNPVDRCSMW